MVKQRKCRKCGIPGHKITTCDRQPKPVPVPAKLGVTGRVIEKTPPAIPAPGARRHGPKPTLARRAATSPAPPAAPAVAASGHNGSTLAQPGPINGAGATRYQLTRVHGNEVVPMGRGTLDELKARAQEHDLLEWTPPDRAYDGYVAIGRAGNYLVSPVPVGVTAEDTKYLRGPQRQKA